VLVDALLAQRRLNRGPQMWSRSVGGTPWPPCSVASKRYSSNITAIVNGGRDGGQQRVPQAGSLGGAATRDIRNCLAAWPGRASATRPVFSITVQGR